MTWFSRKAPAVRNEVVTGISLEDFTRLFTSGSPGDNVTALNAIDAIPVQACVSLIAGGIVSMPLRIVRREIVAGSMTQEPSDDHPYWWLLNEQPNSDTCAAEFWEEIVKRKLLHGRAFARIIRKSGGRSLEIDELQFLPNEAVQVECQWDPVSRRERVTRYIVRDGTYTYGVLPADMLDFRGKTSRNYVTTRGASSVYPQMSDMLRSAKSAVGIVLTIEDYCAKFFANGGMPRTVLQYPAGVNLDTKQMDSIREIWPRKYGGSDNAALPLVLANGGTAQKLSFTAEEAQMLEARKFQVIDIARAFGVPPFMIGETEKTSAWGTGIEQMSQGFIRYTLGPHITAIEQEVNRKMFGIARYFVDFDEESLARGDMKSLGEWFRQAVGGSQGPGFLTVNEVRARLKLPPLEDGDDIYDPNGAPDNEQGTQSTDGAAGDESSQAETL